MKRGRISKWVLGWGLLGLVCAGFLGASTLWALVRFTQTKDLYPKLRYPAPDYRPEVSWEEGRPKDWVRLSSMPRAAWLAVIAAEDGRFFKHTGVEWEQSLGKIRSDIQKRAFPHGISTLNQQIVKNLYFGARPPLFRKLQEIVVARHMDSELEKKRILEIYLNIAEWGSGVVGIGAAARYYFRKPVSRLSDYECALLANLLPSPRVRGAWVKSGRIPRQLSRRVQRTLRRLASTDRSIKAQLWARSESRRSQQLAKP